MYDDQIQATKTSAVNPLFRAFWQDYLSDNEIIDIQGRAINTANSGITIVDIGAKDRPIIYCNEAFSTITGYSSEETLGRNCRFLQGPATDRMTVMLIRNAINKGKPCNVVIKNYRKDGTAFWNELNLSPVHDAGGVLRHFIGVQHDVTTRVDAEQAIKEANKNLEKLVLELATISADLDSANNKLYHYSLHDALTGVVNRMLFDDHLNQAIERRKRQESYHFAVLYVDLDGFKIINDSYGHKMGDKVLVSVAKALQECVRPLDTVARLGGDEFAILLEDLKDLNEAKLVAQRILKSLAQGCDVAERVLYLSASIGIVVDSDTYNTSTEILHDADTAMYKAKTSGKNQSISFEHTMRPAMPGLQTDLREALDKNEFEVYYQPIFSTEAAHLMGFEALIRWNHPTLGLILPNTFISLAEEAGLIIQLDRYVLREGCKQAALWEQQFGKPLMLNVNLSAYQLLRSDLPLFIGHTLRENDFKAAQLKLELTESVMMNPTGAVQDTLKELESMGVQVYIDDFGTGFSSLSYLQHLPSKVLKVDRSFVENVHLKPDSQELVRTIVSLAHNLGMGVVAEGIEVEEQLNVVKALGCEYVQGYWFSAPLSSRDTASYLSRMSN